MAFEDPLVLGSLELPSRMILGTGKYKDLATMQAAHQASGCNMVTVALRRVPVSIPGFNDTASESILDYIDTKKITLLPNTSGAHSAREALRLAHLAREFGHRFLKIEVMGEAKTLLPDPVETIAAVREIRSEYSSNDLFLMVYSNDDPVSALKLVEAGADCIMPAGSPIGSGRGIANTANLRLLLELVHKYVPVILDAGIGSATDAAQAMEFGVDGVLLNSAVAYSNDSPLMAKAIALGVQAGRYSYLAGRMESKLYATASSPE